MNPSSNGERSGETGGMEGGARDDESERSFFGGASLAYRAVMLTVVLIGGIAVVVGLVGTFVTLTGGLDSEEEPEILGEYACGEFDGDPEVVHATDYEVERQVLSASEVSEFNATSINGGVNLTLETEGVLLSASANEPDGQLIEVGTDDDRVLVERDTAEPFRLWVDSVAEDGTVTRMQLDICPP